MNRLLVALVTVLHLVPHPFSVSPIGGAALYAGAFGQPRTAWLVPLVPLFLGDFLGGFYNPTVMLFVYAGFALAAVVGRLFLAGRRSPLRFGSAVVAAATVFYLVSNFSIWLVGMYPPTAAGLAACYLAGLPLLGAAILADAVFAGVLFGAHAALERSGPEAVPA